MNKTFVEKKIEKLLERVDNMSEKEKKDALIFILTTNKHFIEKAFQDNNRLLELMNEAHNIIDTYYEFTKEYGLSEWFKVYLAERKDE